MKNLQKLFLSAASAVAVCAVVASFAVNSFFTSSAAAHTRTIKISISKNGFEPASIDVEKGHRVNLVFNRADADNCGGTVVFPALKIRKALPVGKDVVIPITPQKTGDIAFTCGMGMYKGKIVVSDNGHNE